MLCLSAEYAHGKDGLGSASATLLSSPLPLPQPQPEEAATALVRLLRERPGHYTVVTLGPLTNLALALRLDPEVASLIRRLVVIGGSPSGHGNISPSAEFNVACDPEAAADVFKAMMADVCAAEVRSSVATCSDRNASSLFHLVGLISLNTQRAAMPPGELGRHPCHGCRLCMARYALSRPAHPLRCSARRRLAGPLRPLSRRLPVERPGTTLPCRRLPFWRSTCLGNLAAAGRSAPCCARAARRRVHGHTDARDDRRGDEACGATSADGTAIGRGRRSAERTQCDYHRGNRPRCGNGDNAGTCPLGGRRKLKPR